ncbi:MAG TPA: biotin/lipoyl-binding protein [Syntrophomonadaceae bacterium]|nr:biotin/lipoyl-binding protein [Syntrophomonadaceae bacterium]
MEVTLPFLAEDVDEATVSYWKVEEGDHVAEEDDLVEMSTSKAVFTIPSPVAGTVEEILVQEGDTVKVGQVLCIIKED